MNEIDKTPIKTFSSWLNEEIKLSRVSIPTAVCLSTIGLDGFPNARTVSFKEIIDDRFIITGPLDSRKGKEINNNHQVALTFWWTETERQVRIQGTASKISDRQADRYFKSRDYSSQVVASICKQGEVLQNLQHLENEIINKIDQRADITRPGNWGGFSIKPIRIEFMEFKKNRFHHRKLYEFLDEKWVVKQIQP